MNKTTLAGIAVFVLLAAIVSMPMIHSADAATTKDKKATKTTKAPAKTTKTTKTPAKTSETIIFIFFIMYYSITIRKFAFFMFNIYYIF